MRGARAEPATRVGPAASNVPRRAQQAASRAAVSPDRATPSRRAERRRDVRAEAGRGRRAQRATHRGRPPAQCGAAANCRGKTRRAYVDSMGHQPIARHRRAFDKERAVRITVHLDTFASTDPAAYAILWIDTTERRWSREGHAGVELPAWGNVVCRGGTTRVTGADDPHSLCVLEGLDLGAKQGPFEGETGAAHWYPHAHRAPRRRRMARAVHRRNRRARRARTVHRARGILSQPRRAGTMRAETAVRGAPLGARLVRSSDPVRRRADGFVCPARRFGDARRAGQSIRTAENRAESRTENRAGDRLGNSRG
ncbi:Protein of uncharacterised function (DUF3564) [Burkholderia pseudomallei]|nr:Protein of uncharacterised function (DUF3564) [Burkholderia pseudomallei]